MRVVLFGALGVALMLAAAWVHYAAPGLEERDVTNRPIQVASDGYVSSSACRTSHTRTI